MHRNGTDRHRWGVILAGGDGIRLRPLTRLIAGDDRPKQFCPLFNGCSLFFQTRMRVARRIPGHRTLFVVNQQHEPYYSQEIGRSGPRTIAQPSNRGTLPAILWSVLRVARFDPLATIALFPSDHHYVDEERFMNGVEAAFEAAESNTESVVMLGAQAHRPETAFGWIAPERGCTGYSGFPVHRVSRFWEKPPLEIAQSLFEQDCLWNTFVMVGRVDAFLKIIETVARRWYDALTELTSLVSGSNSKEEFRAATRCYAEMAPSDFSHHAVSANIERFAVLRLGDTGWSDLGDPVRLLSLAASLERKPPERQYVPVQLEFARAAAK